VRLVVRTLLEDALGPVQLALREAQGRIAGLERLAATAQARPQAAATVVLAQTPTPAPVAATPYTSAIAAPARSLAPHPSEMPPAPLLDVAAIERDIPLDLDMRGMSGQRRRRRNIVLFVLGLLIVFGGLFALLADSYRPHP
ncbi:MAG: hypothetical protein ACRELB_15650, partial [Polyangiaceae bacterium]